MEQEQADEKAPIIVQTDAVKRRIATFTAKNNGLP
jgi:hypothetical protein